jgi:lipopolysaccharide transport system permease protein
MIRNLRELYQYRALLWSLTHRELKARYRGSVLGFLWTFLNPMLQMAVYSLVFGFIFKQEEIANYPYFIFVGMLPWIYFSSSVLAGASAVSDRRDLLTKVRFPAQVLPANVVLTNLLNYLLSLPLMVGMGLIVGVVPTWHAIFLLPILMVQTLFTLAVTYVLSALNVAFRDLQQIVANLMTLAFFATPILYPVTRIKSDLFGIPADVVRKLITYGNPMAAMSTAYRDIFYIHQIPNWRPLVAVAMTSILLLWFASAMFEQRREEFAELV